MMALFSCEFKLNCVPFENDKYEIDAQPPYCWMMRFIHISFVNSPGSMHVVGIACTEQ